MKLLVSRDLLGTHVDPHEQTLSRQPRHLTTLTSRCKILQPHSLPKGMAQAPKLLKGGQVPASSQCDPRLGILKTAPVSTIPPLGSAPSLVGTGAVPTCGRAGSVLPLPQPLPWFTGLVMAGTLPIILLTMQNRLQPIPLCRAACQPEQQSHTGNWASGRSLFSAVTTYMHLKTHPPSRKANPERCLPCQGF